MAEETTKCFKHRTEFLAAITGTLSLFTSGTHFGWVGPTILHLKNDDSPIPISNVEASWIAGMLPLGGIFGPVLGTWAADHFGRKTASLLTALPSLITWLLIYLATNVYTLYIAQFLAGISVGACFAVMPMYTGEISSPKIRGKLGNFISLQFNFGILVEYLVVPYTSLKTNAVLIALIPLLFLVTFMWMPESPYFYLMINDEKSAVKSLIKLRRTKEVQPELKSIKDGLSLLQSESESKWNIFKIRSNRKALFIVLGMITAQEFSGLNAIIYYAQIIFSQANSSISANFSGAILAVATLIITIFCSFLVDSWGRRPLLLLSSSLVTIPLFTNGLFFYLQHINYEHLSSLTLLPVISLILYRLLFGLGLGPLPYVCVSEMFPTNIKGVATSLVSIYGSITGFIVAKLYQIMIDNYGVYTVFWSFAGCCILGTAFMYFTVPETKGRTLEKIQEELRGDA